MYVKKTQKTKKCLRCGRSHIVSQIKSVGEIVEGITNAVKKVKQKQNELAINELGNDPDLRSTGDFIISNKEFTEFSIKVNEIQKDIYVNSFKKMLLELTISYNEFPSYILKIMADNYNIPNKELKVLIRNFQKQGVLIRLPNYSYKINQENFKKQIV